MFRRVELEQGEVICSSCSGVGSCSKCHGDGKLDWIENILGKKKQLNKLNGRWTWECSKNLNVLISDELREDLVQSIIGEIDEEIKRKDEVEESRLIKLTMEQKYIKKGD